MAETAAPPSFLEALDEPIAEKAEIAVPDKVTPGRRLKAAGDQQQNRLRNIEDELLEEAMTIMRGALRGAYVDDGQDEIPQEWISKFGMEMASHMLRMARDARQNPKQHPVYLDLAKSLMVGIIKARAAQPREVAALSVSITLAAPSAAYAVIDLEPDTEK